MLLTWLALPDMILAVYFYSGPEVSGSENLMSAYFCPHLMSNYRYLIEFVCLKIDLIGISYNWVY